jgi:type III secretion system export apparatus switch protein
MSSTVKKKATPKKKRDAAMRGQSFKARDLIVACLSLCGVSFIVQSGSLVEIGAVFIGAVRSEFSIEMERYAIDVFWLGFKVVAPIVLMSMVATALPSLLQSRFYLAVGALRLNLGAVNPVKGFNRIFSLRTAKDFIKTLLYLLCFGFAVCLIWWRHRNLIFSQVHASIPQIIKVWKTLIEDLFFICLGCISIVLILDALVELFIYLKELRMDKSEIQREQKESDGDPLIKKKRKMIRMEFLTEQEKHDVENSRMIIANPTHIAVGIYFKPEFSPIPFVSIRQRNQRALAIRHYAEKIGVPVIVDVSLARRLYRTHQLYSMVNMEEIHVIVALLLWLQEVELAGICDDEIIDDDSQGQADDA